MNAKDSVSCLMCWRLPLFWESAIKNSKWQLLNLKVGEAKLSINSSRKNREENRTGQEAFPVLISFVKAWVDFRFYREMRNMDDFIKQ